MRPKGSAEALEVRRRLAGKLLMEGKGPREVARIVGASPGSVDRWKKALARGGMEALSSKPHPGRPCALSAQQLSKLKKILLKGPLKAGYTTDLWTLPRIVEVIKKHFGITYHSTSVWHILRRMRWSAQKPERRARERDEEAIRDWVDKDWPRIKKSP